MVAVTVTAEALSVVEEDGRRWLRAGRFGIAVGDVQSPATRSLEVHGGGVLLEDHAKHY